MKISVALCTFNGAPFLPEQLESLLAQERLPDELVVCDDGSTDATLAMLAEFRARSPFPVAVHENQGRLGPAKNFEKAMRLCQGDLIALCDQDDVWLPQKLRLAERGFQDRPALEALFADGLLVDRALDRLGGSLWEHVNFSAAEQRRFDSGAALAVLLKHAVVTGATLVVRASARSRILPIGAGWMHDAWIGAVAASGGRLGVIAEPVFLYRQHGGNVAGMPFKSALERVRETMKLPRSEYYAGEIARYLALEDALASMPDPAPADAARLVRAKLAHLRMRAGLPANRIARIPFIALELCRLGYRRYSVDWRVAVRDFLLPENGR